MGEGDDATLASVRTLHGRRDASKVCPTMWSDMFCIRNGWMQEH